MSLSGRTEALEGMHGERASVHVHALGSMIEVPWYSTWTDWDYFPSPQPPDEHGTVLLCLLAEGDEELHLVSASKLGKLTAPSHRVHVKEDTVSVALAFTDAGDKAILGRMEGERERERGREGGG